ncbi:MAG: hypothetical protein U5K43_07600 [Halofilum sp. (in: g-proteobacteria)]|nr:hypothetical protein [Halofilum sp. (in: g-proteobacteria)]
MLAAAPAPAADPPIRIDGVTYLGDLPTLVAEHRGLFTRNGIRAEVRHGDSGKQNLGRLRAGETDFALMALTPWCWTSWPTRPRPARDDPVALASAGPRHPAAPGARARRRPGAAAGRPGRSPRGARARHQRRVRLGDVRAIPRARPRRGHAGRSGRGRGARRARRRRRRRGRALGALDRTRAGAARRTPAHAVRQQRLHRQVDAR